MGPWVPIVAPAAAAGHRLRGQLVGKVVPPLWQYFARLQKRHSR
jgi:hypothetical protein